MGLHQQDKKENSSDGTITLCRPHLLHQKSYRFPELRQTDTPDAWLTL